MKSQIKKALAAFAAVAMLATMSTTTFAATLDQDTTSDDAIVVYQAGERLDDNETPEDPTDDTMGGTYTVTVPEYIIAADVGGDPTEEAVTATDVLIPYGTNLTVDVEFDGELELQDNAATTLTYEMQNNGSAISTGDTILTVAAGDPDGSSSTQIGAVLTQAPSYAGVYTDTAVFTSSVA